LKLDFLEHFNDPYLKKPEGKGVFLAGVLLGFIALNQVGRNKDKLGEAPLFKQIQFGRMNMKGLKKLLGRVPTLLQAYRENMRGSIPALNTLLGEVNRFLLEGESQELGTDGNFAFTAGFSNANDYYWKIFGKQE